MVKDKKNIKNKKKNSPIKFVQNNFLFRLEPGRQHVIFFPTILGSSLHDKLSQIYQKLFFDSLVF